MLQVFLISFDRNRIAACIRHASCSSKYSSFVHQNVPTSDTRPHTHSACISSPWNGSDGCKCRSLPLLKANSAVQIP